MRKLMPLIMVALLPLAACSEGFPVGGDTSIEIRTQPPMSSSCLVRSRAGAWDVPNTPEHVQVDKSSGPLAIKCSSPRGWEGGVTVQSSVSTEGVVQTVVLGGIATGVFAATQPGMAAGYVAAAGAGFEGSSFGAAAVGGQLWEYPRVIVVPMHQIKVDPEPGLVSPIGAVPQAPAPRVAPPPRHRVHVRHVPRPVCRCVADHPGS